MRRFFQAAFFSLLVTGALVVAVPSKRTATARLEIWVLAVLVGLALVHLVRRRLPSGADPLARRPKPEPVSADPAEVESLSLALSLAASPHPRVRRNAEIDLRDALRSAGVSDEDGELPTSPSEWSSLLDRVEAS
ncbi:MAG: hypothetical protein EHM63_03150 [Actinobacteria bacterium]|jgi:hypothetical protein|nr:MAG: hypothetical protein EHM63_03150 [Actinomycetota bacterium]